MSKHIRITSLCVKKELQYILETRQLNIFQKNLYKKEYQIPKISKKILGK